jgi:hypothetical protein
MKTIKILATDLKPGHVIIPENFPTARVSVSSVDVQEDRVNVEGYSGSCLVELSGTPDTQVEVLA